MQLNLNETGWVVIEGAANEYTFQTRFREFSAKPETTEYPQRLNIFWNMTESQEDGFPTKKELEILHTFENRLITAVEHDEFSIMSMVLTGNGTREFVFHTPNPQEFIRRLTEMPQEKDRYPIEINLNADPTWDYYYDHLNSAKQATGHS